MKKPEVTDMNTGQSWKTVEDYIKWLIEEGYTEEDLSPKKCHKCNSKKLKSKNENYIAGFIEEYDVFCTECGTIVGHWAHGSWCI